MLSIKNIDSECFRSNCEEVTFSISTSRPILSVESKAKQYSINNIQRDIGSIDANFLQPAGRMYHRKKRKWVIVWSPDLFHAISSQGHALKRRSSLTIVEHFARFRTAIFISLLFDDSNDGVSQHNAGWSTTRYIEIIGCFVSFQFMTTSL